MLYLKLFFSLKTFYKKNLSKFYAEYYIYIDKMLTHLAQKSRLFVCCHMTTIKCKKQAQK